jgi:phosphohistidine swiveling domain-containing protein
MEKKLPIRPEGELFKWGPIPGFFYYTCDFQGINRHFSGEYRGERPWPKVVFIFRDGRMFWTNEMPAMVENGKEAFLKYMLPIETRRKAYSDWKNDVRRLGTTERRIGELDLSRLETDKFAELCRVLFDQLLRFWSHGILPELAGYGGDKILEAELGKHMKNKDELSQAMEILTAPEKLSFYQKEELELGETDDVRGHAMKFCWIRNSYGGMKKSDEAFFEKRKRELPGNYREILSEKKKETKKRKIKLQKKYRLPEEVMEIAATIVDCIEWQDERKKHIFTFLGYKDIVLDEMARRLALPKEDLLNYSNDEILDMLCGMGNQINLSDRRKSFAVIMDARKMQIEGPAEADEYWKAYSGENVSGTIKEFRGIVVSKGGGIVKGKSRIVSDPFKMKGFRKGDVLVASMTSPEYIFIMKKAAAVITDTGGLTSHAAIVSRELGIPCITGTKIATNLLKDGNLVEVDTSKGTVRIIK